MFKNTLAAIGVQFLAVILFGLSTYFPERTYLMFVDMEFYNNLTLIIIASLVMSSFIIGYLLTKVKVEF